MRKRIGIEGRKFLRTEAETIAKNFSVGAHATQPSEKLIHELLVHKIELEIQNEELRRAQIAVEEARDRYVDLYEFAPVGYVSISPGGAINEINLTGAAMLGMDRAKLINCHFSKFVTDLDKDRWYRLFVCMMKHLKEQQHTFSLKMKRADGSQFYAHLNCLLKKALKAPPVLRIAVTDLTQREVMCEPAK